MVERKPHWRIPEKPPGGGTKIADGTKRKDIVPGALVDIVLKRDQQSGKLTRGVVSEILTNSSVHPRGIKVRLENGKVGRVHAVIQTKKS